MKNRWFISAIVWAWSAFTAASQPVPKLTSISPEWVTRGSSVEVTISGDNLGNVVGFVFSGDPGLTASNAPPAPKPSVTIESSEGGIVTAESKDNKKLRVRITAAVDAAVGQRELRLRSPQGISNPIALNVGHLPEVGESEPNNSADQAQKISLPAAISGVIKTAAEVDYYQFNGHKGEELVFEVVASRTGSLLDSSLVILDAHGKELARSEDARGLDSVIYFTVPEDGDNSETSGFKAAMISSIVFTPERCLTSIPSSRWVDGAAARSSWPSAGTTWTAHRKPPWKSLRLRGWADRTFVCIRRGDFPT
jgi:hypothetical protein